MYRENLYNKVLLDPLKNFRVNELYIVSGYASATFAKRHLIDTKKSNPRINLIIGMPGKKNDHIAFVELHNQFADRFNGYYLNSQPPVHSKTYSWCYHSNGVMGFSGSSNYSQQGFIDSSQINQMTKDDPLQIKRFFEELLQKSTPMTEWEYETSLGDIIPAFKGRISPGKTEWTAENTVKISFLDRRTGNLPARSGLNWGQREGREPNQAYLSLKGDSRREEFLPDMALRFTLITDDNKSFDCVVAQEGRKAIETTDDNSLLGKYIRKRIGVQLGQLVTRQDLENYGRTDFAVTKLDEETFLFDFSV